MRPNKNGLHVVLAMIVALTMTFGIPSTAIALVDDQASSTASSDSDSDQDQESDTTKTAVVESNPPVEDDSYLIEESEDVSDTSSEQEETSGTSPPSDDEEQLAEPTSNPVGVSEVTSSVEDNGSSASEEESKPVEKKQPVEKDEPASSEDNADDASEDTTELDDAADSTEELVGEPNEYGTGDITFDNSRVANELILGVTVVSTVGPITANVYFEQLSVGNRPIKDVTGLGTSTVTFNAELKTCDDADFIYQGRVDDGTPEGGLLTAAPEQTPDLNCDGTNPDITIVAVPPQPSDDGAGNWIVPEDTDVFDWNQDDEGNLTVTIVADGTTFPDGSTTKSYGQAPPPDPIFVSPVAPNFSNDEQGSITIDEAEFVEYFWTNSNGTVEGSVIPEGVAVTVNSIGLPFVDGATVYIGARAVEPASFDDDVENVFSHTFTIDPDITIIAVPEAPGIDEDGHWIVPKDTDVLDWNQDDEGNLTVTILAKDTTFPNGKIVKDYGQAPKSDPNFVTLVAPSFFNGNADKEEPPSFTIKSAKFVEYFWTNEGGTVEGAVIPEGEAITVNADGDTFTNGETVYIAARAVDGASFEDEVNTLFEHTFVINSGGGEPSEGPDPESIYVFGDGPSGVDDQCFNADYYGYGEYNGVRDGGLVIGELLVDGMVVSSDSVPFSKDGVAEISTGDLPRGESFVFFIGFVYLDDESTVYALTDPEAVIRPTVEQCKVASSPTKPEPKPGETPERPAHPSIPVPVKPVQPESPAVVVVVEGSSNKNNVEVKVDVKADTKSSAKAESKVVVKPPKKAADHGDRTGSNYDTGVDEGFGAMLSFLAPAFLSLFGLAALAIVGLRRKRLV